MRNNVKVYSLEKAGEGLPIKLTELSRWVSFAPRCSVGDMCGEPPTNGPKLRVYSSATDIFGKEPDASATTAIFLPLTVVLALT